MQAFYVPDLLMKGKMSSNIRGWTTAKLRIDKTGFHGNGLEVVVGDFALADSALQRVPELLLVDMLSSRVRSLSLNS